MPVKPAISVVMPLFNKAAFVERAVASVVAQNYADFELLIIDDGSTDDGVKRVQSRFNDPRVKIIRQPNAGVGAARNRALREARGDIIAFLDADDEWFETHLSDLLHLAGKFPEAGILASRFIWIIGDKLLANNRISISEPCLIRDYFARSAPPDGTFINASSCGVRADIARAMGGFLEAAPYGEDLEYWARISLSYPLAFHPRISAIYHYGTSGSATSTERWSAAEKPVVRTLRQYLLTQPNSPIRSSVLNYAASIILTQAAAGIASNESRAANRLLADPILAESRFHRRLRVLRFAAALPERIARAAVRIHNTPGLGFWRRLYFKITSVDSAGLATSGAECAGIGSHSVFHSE